MPVLKHFEQMHKPFDNEKVTKPKAGCDPEALAGLRQALEAEDGFALLTGPVGAGKSTLVQELQLHLTCMVCRVTIPDEEMTKLSFRQFLADSLGLESMAQSRGAFLLKIRDFLMSEAVKGSRIIIVLESIQRLQKKLFKELELLSDIRIRDRNPISFLFVGLIEAESIFSDPHLAKIANRICAKFRLTGVNSDDLSNFDDDPEPPEPVSQVQPVQPEGTLPLGSSQEPDANPAVVNPFQESDWEDLGVINYIDGTKLGKDPDQPRSEKKWRISATEHRRGVDDGWDKDPALNEPVLSRWRGSSFMWGAFGAISVLLLFLAVWIHFFDESGALSRFFTDTATKIETTLQSFWQSDTDDASPVATTEPPLSSPEASGPEPANPASTGGDSAATWSWKPGTEVQFDSNSYIIGPEYMKLLDQVAAHLKRHPAQRISLRSYSNNIGSKENNLFISKFQALVVKNCLIGKGVSAERMQILGMGETYSADANDTREGRQRSRWVEIEF